MKVPSDFLEYQGDEHEDGRVVEDEELENLYRNSTEEMEDD